MSSNRAPQTNCAELVNLRVVGEAAGCRPPPPAGRLWWQTASSPSRCPPGPSVAADVRRAGSGAHRTQDLASDHQCLSSRGARTRPDAWFLTLQRSSRCGFLRCRDRRELRLLDGRTSRLAALCAFSAGRVARWESVFAARSPLLGQAADAASDRRCRRARRAWPERGGSAIVPPSAVGAADWVTRRSRPSRRASGVHTSRRRFRPHPYLAQSACHRGKTSQTSRRGGNMRQTAPEHRRTPSRAGLNARLHSRRA